MSNPIEKQILNHILADMQPTRYKWAKRGATRVLGGAIGGLAQLFGVAQTKQLLQELLQDDPFWETMSSLVSDPEVQRPQDKLEQEYKERSNEESD